MIQEEIESLLEEMTPGYRPELVERLVAIYNKQDKQLDRVMAERDRAEEFADALAFKIAPIEVIGEHSNLNNPWQNALDYEEESR